jgi:plastocyanin
MTIVVIAIVIIPLASSIPSKPTLASHNVIASPTTAHHTFWLLGSIMGWNQSRPGPLVTVTDGDLVTIMYNSVDSAPHTWFVDANNNNIPDPGEISSPTVTTSATLYVNFTFTLKVGTNVPSAGDFTYRCSYHPTMMFGTFRVQAMPDFKIGLSSPTLTVAPGASRNVVVTLTSLAGFSSTVALTSSISPTGPQVTFSPTSLLVPSGGSINSTLGVSTPSSGTYSSPVSQGSYTVNVTATSGLLVHTSTLSLTVGSPSGVGDLTGSAIIIGGVGAGIVVAAAAVYALRRRTRTTT